MLRFLMTIFAVVFFSSNAIAEDNMAFDKHSMNEEGFSEVSKIFDEMTPEQREAVLLQAKGIMQELEKMPKEEQERIKELAKEIYESMNLKSIKVKEIKVENGKDLAGISADLSEFKKRHQ